MIAKIVRPVHEMEQMNCRYLWMVFKGLRYLDMLIVRGRKHNDKIWVYDDEFVKAMIHINGTQIVEVYVDTFFENQGIGAKLVEYAIEQMNCDWLWVLEKNTRAVHFYKKHGFALTEEKQYEEGTTEFIVKMKR